MYPTTISIKDEVAFVASCEAVTSASYKGEDHCKLISSERTIWIYNAFMDQSAYTSEIAVSFLMTNPSTNRLKDTSSMSAEEKLQHDYDVSFHFESFTFDLDHDFPDVISS